MSEKSFMSLNSFTISRKEKRRVGRGTGSGLGRKCGAGDKGQSARSGVSMIRRHSEYITRLPKVGFKSKTVKMNTITLKQIVHIMSKNPNQKSFDFSAMKLIGSAELNSSISVKVGKISKGSMDIINKAGGSVEVQKA